MYDTDSPTANDAGPLVAYYRGRRPDGGGRKISTIHAWGDAQLEQTHDFIQWLFPLTEPSAVHPEAPVLDDQQIRQFRSDPDLQATVLGSLETMLRFYGLVCDADPHRPTIAPAARFERRRSRWMKPGNHNYLRLTRIIKSLHLLGLAPYADALFACLDKLYRSYVDQIGPITYAYWAEAAGRPIDPKEPSP